MTEKPNLSSDILVAVFKHDRHRLQQQFDIYHSSTKFPEKHNITQDCTAHLIDCADSETAEHYKQYNFRDSLEHCTQDEDTSSHYLWLLIGQTFCYLFLCV